MIAEEMGPTRCFLSVRIENGCAQMKAVRTALSVAVADGHCLKTFDIRGIFTFSDALTN